VNIQRKASSRKYLRLARNIALAALMVKLILAIWGLTIGAR